MQPEAPATDVPARVAHYALRDAIGHGGMATVYRAVDDRLDREVALKLLRPEQALEPSGRTRFLREARAMAQLSHVHVVPVHDVGEEGDHCYIAMELMEGSVAEAGAPLSTAKAVRWIRQACEGVSCAHAAGVLHRDLKPQNLLVGSDGRIRVSDFGIARIEDETALTMTGQRMGTPSFAAPEQMRGETATERSDVYGLGATLYFLLVGSAPPRPLGSSAAAPPLPAAVPAALARVVQDALAPAPEARPPSVEALHEALAPHAGQPPRARWPWIAATAVALTVAFAVGWPTRTEAPSDPATPAAPPREAAFLIWKGNADTWTATDAEVAQLQAAGLRWAQLTEGALAQRQSLLNGVFSYSVTLDFVYDRHVLTLASGREELGRVLLDRLGLERADWRLREPAIDVDGDGILDTVLRAGPRMALLKWDTGRLGPSHQGWETALPGLISYGSPAVVDWDGDGAPEVFVGDVGADRRDARPLAAGRLYQLSYLSGLVQSSWPLPHNYRSTPQVARSPQGAPLALYVDAAVNHIGSISMLDAADPTRLQELPGTRGLEESGWPAFQDIDGDGDPELFAATATGGLLCFDRRGAGEPLWAHVETGRPSYLAFSQQDSDALLEICYGQGSRMSCVNTEPQPGDDPRVAWSAALEEGDEFTHQLIEIGDLNGDGISELAAGSLQGRLYVFSRAAPGGRLHTTVLPAQAEISPGEGRAFARLLHLPPEAAGEPQRVVMATAFEGIVTWEVDAEGARVLWRYPTGRILASPVPARGGALIASYDGWLRLLASDRPTLRWSFRAWAGIGGTPVVREDGGLERVVFTDVSGTVYKVTLP